MDVSRVCASEIPYEIRCAVRQFNEIEYNQTEQQREHSVVSSETIETFIEDISESVEGQFEKKLELAALRKALRHLSKEERAMIDENFFHNGAKPTYYLARQCGTTCRSYEKRLRNLLAKLRTYVEYYLNSDYLTV